ncbi:probable RNA-binding protein ARP1 [Durio zibethinus]|uniref:Probable RNA-binding protein ARP1 n=1 Tax=Durio zibethinus TaxID=66656 RepID=A0A6P5Z623_DURZI|nr:probable RNA-binding protein ARP1 [Durio zibethinus]
MTMSSNIGQFGDTTLTKVFVGGLAWETPKEAMREHFDKYGSNVGPRVTSPAPAPHVQWYYLTASPFRHQHHQAVPFHGYSPAYIATDISYNHKLSYSGGSYTNGHISQVYPAGQAMVGANALMPMYPFYHYHQSQTMGFPAATHIFPRTAGPINTVPAAAAAAATAAIISKPAALIAPNSGTTGTGESFKKKVC